MHHISAFALFWSHLLSSVRTRALYSSLSFHATKMQGVASQRGDALQLIFLLRLGDGAAEMHREQSDGNKDDEAGEKREEFKDVFHRLVKVRKE